MNKWNSTATKDTFHHDKDGQPLFEGDFVLVNHTPAHIEWDSTDTRWVLEFIDETLPLNQFKREEITLTTKHKV